jgi:hypothetical protein
MVCLRKGLKVSHQLKLDRDRIRWQIFGAEGADNSGCVPSGLGAESADPSGSVPSAPFSTVCLKSSSQGLSTGVRKV